MNFSVRIMGFPCQKMRHMLKSMVVKTNCQNQQPGRQPRMPKIQIRKKKVDPGKLSFITSSNTDEGADIGIVFVGPGTIMETWDNTTRNKFTRYAFMVRT